MTTKFWFLPTSKTLYSKVDNKTHEYFMGRISGEFKNYEDTVGVLSGEFAVSCSNVQISEVNNIISVSTDAFSKLTKANETENIIFIFEVEENLSLSTFNQFAENILVLVNFEVLTISKYTQSIKKPFLKNYSSVHKYIDRDTGVGRADILTIINEFQEAIFKKDITFIPHLSYQVEYIIEMALVVRHVESLQDLYMRLYAGSKADDASYVKKINDYLSRYLQKNNEEDNLSTIDGGMYSKWATAYYMKKDEFEETFKEVSETDDEDWNGYSFLTFARGKLIIPSNMLSKYGFHADINTIAFPNLLEAYSKLDIRSNHLNNFISNVLIFEVDKELNKSKKEVRQSFYLLQVSAVILSAAVGFLSASLISILLTYLIFNVVGISKNLMYSKLIKTHLNVDTYCDLNTLINLTQLIRNNGVTFSIDTENYLSYLPKILNK